MEEAFGPYRLLRRLGEGSMAEVFLARRADAPDSKHIVVKRMLRRHRGQEALLEMFLTEARLALRLSHPNLIDVHDTGDVDGEYYIAMEHVVGVDLFELLDTRDDRPLPPDVSARILLDVCAGLHYMHETGVVHNDVNPHNILVALDGRSKLTDFGVAITEHAVDENVRGTPAYMSPEQVRNGALDRRTDVFAVGVILWEIFSGKRLFGGHPPYITIAKIVEEQAPALADTQLDQIAQRALAKDRDARYPSCAALAADLERAALDRGWSETFESVRALVERLSRG